ncbi:MAG: hypothetical protein KKB37_01720 [Alphaproteobacteria bacterium]|nr:hypothetical protein [Alphaproteobacteria bacterium]
MATADQANRRNAQTVMPRTVKYAAFGVVTLIVAGGIYLIVMRGPAIILDMAASAVAFICM